MTKLYGISMMSLDEPTDVDDALWSRLYGSQDHAIRALIGEWNDNYASDDGERHTDLLADDADLEDLNEAFEKVGLTPRIHEFTLGDEA